MKYPLLPSLNFFIPALLLFWAQASSACHPNVNPNLPQYIVGYGSLIDESSKKRSDASAEENIPVMIKGYKRSWSAHGNLPGVNATFLSVEEDSASSFNGVIYKLSSPDRMKQYDKRERIYCRKEIALDQIATYSETLPEKKQVWIYMPDKRYNEPPAPDYPITQSYVDMFIRGCIQVEEKYSINNFASDCVTSTDQWPRYWVNDRIFPRRPSLYEPYAAQIDMLLKTLLPEQFRSIVIE